MENTLIDLLMLNGDIVLDKNGLPTLIGGRDVVAQDIGNRLDDSGYVFALLGERSQNEIKSLLLKIRLEVENDSRVIPGTVKTEFNLLEESGVLNITAETLLGDVDIAKPIILEDTLTEADYRRITFNGRRLLFKTRNLAFSI